MKDVNKTLLVLFLLALVVIVILLADRRMDEAVVWVCEDEDTSVLIRQPEGLDPPSILHGEFEIDCIPFDVYLQQRNPQ